MRRAVIDHPDAYLRTTVLETSPGRPSVLTVVRPPVDPDARPQQLVPVNWTRPSAGIKHVGTFPQIQFGRTAEADGYDDALLVDADGFVAETTIANIAFVRGREVVWPEGPVLPGITWQLLDEHLPDHGFTARTQRVRLADVGRFDAAVLANSIGVVAVGRIGDHRLDSAVAAAELAGIYDAVPQQAL